MIQLLTRDNFHTVFIPGFHKQEHLGSNYCGDYTTNRVRIDGSSCVTMTV